MANKPQDSAPTEPQAPEQTESVAELTAQLKAGIAEVEQLKADLKSEIASVKDDREQLKADRELQDDAKIAADARAVAAAKKVDVVEEYKNWRGEKEEFVVKFFGHWNGAKVNVVRNGKKAVKELPANIYGFAELVGLKVNDIYRALDMPEYIKTQIVVEGDNKSIDDLDYEI